MRAQDDHSHGQTDGEDYDSVMGEQAGREAYAEYYARRKRDRAVVEAVATACTFHYPSDERRRRQEAVA